jgi:PTS system mannose-specific IIA component
MVGFLIVTHSRIGSEMLATVKEIIKDNPAIISVEIGTEETYLDSQKKIQKAIEGFKDREGVIIFTDLFGATPGNLCKEFLKNGKIEMITGCNLPMIIKAAITDFKESPSQVAQFLKNYGKDNIRVYSTDY